MDTHNQQTAPLHSYTLSTSQLCASTGLVQLASDFATPYTVWLTDCSLYTQQGFWFSMDALLCVQGTAGASGGLKLAYSVSCSACTFCTEQFTYAWPTTCARYICWCLTCCLLVKLHHTGGAVCIITMLRQPWKHALKGAAIHSAYTSRYSAQVFSAELEDHI